MLVFLFDYSHFNKLLEIVSSVWYSFNNLLERKKSSKETCIECPWLNRIKVTFIFQSIG